MKQLLRSITIAEVAKAAGYEIDDFGLYKNKPKSSLENHQRAQKSPLGPGARRASALISPKP